MKKRAYMLCFIAVPLLLTGCAAPAPCAGDFTSAPVSYEAEPENLLKAKTVADIPPALEVSDEIILKAADFSAELLQASAAEGGNAVVCPPAVMEALAMAALGAAGEAKAQLLGALGLTAEEIAAYASFLAAPGGEGASFSQAASLWFEDFIEPSDSFLGNCSSLLGAEIFATTFDAWTADKIGGWISDKTDGMINGLTGGVSETDVMVLLAAAFFDAEWKQIYGDHDVKAGVFHSLSDGEQEARMMASFETLYIEYGGGCGFLKPYKGGRFAFAALLPAEGSDIYEYISSLGGRSFIKTIKGAREATVVSRMPAFSFDYSLSLEDALEAAGVTDAFSPEKADFSSIGGNSAELFLSDVRQTASIRADQFGTKAGAAAFATYGCPPDYYVVTLDRPFVFAVVELSSGAPLFMGALTSLK